MVLEDEKLRFRWDDLLAVTAHLPGTGGETRTVPEDFVVTEMPSYLPSGTGVHLYAYVEKRGLTTRDLVNALKKQGVPERAIGVAGLKDKQAVTRQWLSVPQEFADCLDALEQLEGVSILEKSRHGNKLGVGHLRANRFEVTVHDSLPDSLARAQAILHHIKTVGLPNYFGPQRYGRFNSNAQDAMRLVRGEMISGGRKLHDFFLVALQSHLFNWMLTRRIERGLYDRVVKGDMAQKHDTGGMF
ncbi:MAG: tRNA pseudouridine(13) synthase TruD, partial [Ardenticatenaceae bacterium]